MPNPTFQLHLQDAANLRLEQANLIYRARGAGDVRAFASIHRVDLESSRLDIALRALGQLSKHGVYAASKLSVPRR